MLKSFNNIKTHLHLPLLGLYAKVLSLFFALRILFVLTNGSTFTKIDFNQLFDAFLFGFRLDLIPTFYIITALYLVYLTFESKVLTTVLLSLFVAIVTFVGIIDALYFKFLKEHIGYSFFHQLNPDNNISLWTYVANYWYMALLGLVLTVAITLWLRQSLRVKQKTNWISLSLIVVVAFVIARGGFRLKPLRTADSGSYLSSATHVVSYNVPFYIFESWQNPITTPGFIDGFETSISSSNFAKDSIVAPNIVIIVLESFGKEYTGLNRGMTHTYTPFLNSLFPKSICCHNAYANGLKSVDAVPAIFTGLPKLSSTAIIHSPKSSNQVPSLFNCLQSLGYSSSFFHGANNETMGFKSYLTTNGLHDYYGLDEYPKQEDLDGHWGVLDEPYLQYVSDNLSTQKQPFVSGIFTLSSHHPYTIPTEYKDSFLKGNIPIHKSIQYADMALKKFMESCEKTAWFDNTIFIITADHSAENLLHAYRTPSGKFEIPLILYSPKLLKPQAIRKTVEQIDILPTVLDYVGYPQDITLLGHSIFEENNNEFVTHFDNNTYHITKNNWSYGIHLTQDAFLFNRSQDINCLTNLESKFPQMEEVLDSNLKQALFKYFYVVNQE